MNKNQHHSNESKLKISISTKKAMKKQIIRKKYLIGIKNRKISYGRKLSIITKKRISAAVRLVMKDSKNRMKCASWKNKKLSLQHRKNISIGTQRRKKIYGYINSPSARKKISNSKKGIKFSKKHKLNLSKALIGNISPMKGKKHNFLTKRKLRIARIKQMKKAFGKKWIQYNENACMFFERLNNMLNIDGQHALRRGEYIIPILGYVVDFYDKKNNIIIEWNEQNHYDKGRLNNKHNIRQKRIKSLLKCDFININQKKFNEDKVIEKYKNILNKNKIYLGKVK